MKLTVSCQICGRIMQQIDNGLGDDVPFTPDQAALYAAGVSCEVDGNTNIAAFFTRTESADAIQIKLGIALAQLQDALDQIGTLQAAISQLQYDFSLLSDPEDLLGQLQAANDQLAYDQSLLSDLQQQVNDQTTKAQIFAGAMHQEKALGERANLLADMIEYQITSSAPQMPQVKALMDELQALVKQVTAVADDSLGEPPPQDLGTWVNFPVERYDDFQLYLASQDPVIDPISEPDGMGMVNMKQAQYQAWLQFLAT